MLNILGASENGLHNGESTTAACTARAGELKDPEHDREVTFTAMQSTVLFHVTWRLSIRD